MELETPAFAGFSFFTAAIQSGQCVSSAHRGYRFDLDVRLIEQRQHNPIQFVIAK